MNQSQKDKLFAEAKERVYAATKDIAARIPIAKSDIERIKQELAGARSPEEKTVKRSLFKIYNEKLDGFQNGLDSPYFSRCDITQKDNKSKTLYFGKYSIPELNIYSWVSPASRIRFAPPGPFSYQSENGNETSGTLRRNDQYLTAGGNITFMATADLEYPRTLIYQEHFSNRKSAFILPEIVERMEQAQDTVIRAEHRGSFLISGPAGSGKTTLALHRVAYLLQSPEFANYFKAENILVLVQDDSTKQYFDELLPSLGIKDVAITTFASWARERLELPGFGFVNRYGTNEIQRDNYEFAKNKSLKKIDASDRIGRSPFGWLEKLYIPHFTPELKKLFERQRKEKVLDRFDLTALLMARIKKEGSLTKEEKYMTNIPSTRHASHGPPPPLSIRSFCWMKSRIIFRNKSVS